MAERTLRAFWWNGHANLGDALTPLLLEHFGYGVERVEPADAEICVVGSVLELLGSSFSGSILGAGFLSAGAPLKFPNARFLAVRGPLSAARAGLSDDIARGDPGLLCPLLVERARARHARIGVVPHYKDKANPVVAALAERAHQGVRIIDVQADPRGVLQEIAECEVVLSSSLHGLVAADAFGIPAGWLKLSDAVLGAGFKFVDYGLGAGLAPTPQLITGEETIDQLAALGVKKDFDRTAMQRRLENLFRAL